jgi:hypothetical protein
MFSTGISEKVPVPSDNQTQGLSTATDDVLAQGQGGNT